MAGQARIHELTIFAMAYTRRFTQRAVCAALNTTYQVDYYTPVQVKGLIANLDHSNSGLGQVIDPKECRIYDPLEVMTMVVLLPWVKLLKLPPGAPKAETMLLRRMWIRVVSRALADLDTKSPLSRGGWLVIPKNGELPLDPYDVIVKHPPRAKKLNKGAEVINLHDIHRTVKICLGLIDRLMKQEEQKTQKRDCPALQIKAMKFCSEAAQAKLAQKAVRVDE